MVVDRTLVIKNLQQEIELRKQGIMMVVCLVNKDELNILIDDPAKVIGRFYTIVDIACQESIEYSIIKDFEPTKLYIFIPNNLKVAEKLAYSIYSQVQLDVDRELPESYLKCSVQSIRFPQNRYHDVEKLLSLLNYGNFISTDKSYYFNYDENPVDIESLRAKNTKLNLLRVSLFQRSAKFVYQPIVDRETGDISYYECLLRVKNQENKWVSVGNMVSDAESKGLISIVDFTVVEMAILELHRDKNISLSVNISNIGVLNKRLLRRIESLLKKYDVAKRLIIEITETSLNDDFQSTKIFIDTLHKAGCRFALDDFGSGFTSFQQLLNLPIDIIKIDGSYIRDILKNDHSRFFVEALIKLAADLGIKTVAEFVENGEIARFLIDIKIGGMQGNFFLPASNDRIT
jgi:EAL domain-containing protein (putative c-di-GMP-specific phosphodiesterase class I)